MTDVKESADPFPTVVSASAGAGLTLHLTFADGTVGSVDIEPIVHRSSSFQLLRDRSYFERLVVDTEMGTVAWPNGFDISPSVLLEHLVEGENERLERGSESAQGLLQFYGKVLSSQLHYGDNLSVLSERVPDLSVDLVYLDPPFNSNKNYNVLYRTPSGQVPEESKRAFRDSWVWDASSERQYRSLTDGTDQGSLALRALRTLLGESDLMAYLTMMTARLIEIRRVLKPTGSIYLHCDYRTSHYLKILMDAVYGAENFLNNVVWLYELGGSSSKYWPRKHDDLLWYSRDTGNHFFEPDMIPAKSNRMRGESKKALDWWQIPSLNNMAKERLGYPTQKPLALLERIVRSSSPEGGVVLDPFCGCGTTIEAAEKLGRTWIGIDVSFLAVEIAERRLERSFGTSIASKYKLYGAPQDIQEAKTLYEQRPLDFGYWAVGLVEGDPLVDESNDFEGIRSFPMPEGEADGRVAIKVGSGRADLRTASSAVDDGKASLGVVVSLHPNESLAQAAAEHGSWTWPINGREYPRLQVVSIEEVLTGTKLDLPTSMQQFPFVGAI